MSLPLDFARPSLFALLVLAVILVWFFRRRAARPEIEATGTLEIWKRSASDAPRSFANPRIPPAVWWLVAAIVMGVIALAGPREPRTAKSSRLLVVVDRSPSMYLMDGARTRLEHALELALERIALLAYDEVAWIAPPITEDETRASKEFQNDWLTPPLFAVSEPNWASFDREDVMLVTDKTLENELKKAGFCASGGDAVPGPIGVEGRHSIVFDGAEVREGAPAGGTSVIVEDGVPDEIERIARAWATARDFHALEYQRLARDAVRIEPPAKNSLRRTLTLYSAEGRSPRSSEVARDGWSARAEFSTPLALRDAAGPLEAWLTTSSGDAVVANAPGRVHIALRTIEKMRGDPAAWAVSWSRLFDETLTLPEGCVSIVERMSASRPASRDPLRSQTATRESIGPWTAISAAAAALAALVAVWLALAPKRAARVRVP